MYPGPVVRDVSPGHVSRLVPGHEAAHHVGGFLGDALSAHSAASHWEGEVGRRRNYEWETEEVPGGPRYNRLRRVSTQAFGPLTAPGPLQVPVPAPGQQKPVQPVPGLCSCLASHCHYLLLLLLLVGALAAATYSWVTCDSLPVLEASLRDYRLLDIQYTGQQQEQEARPGLEDREQDREGGYFPYFPAKLQRSSSNSSRLASSKPEAEVLTTGCVWPLVALVVTVVSLLVLVVVILVTIANTLK